MMEIAYGHPPYHLLRTQTAPVASGGVVTASAMANPHHSAQLAHSQAHTSSNYSIQSQPSSRSSDTTQGTSHSTLFPAYQPPPPLPKDASIMAAATPPPPSGDMVTATDNVMNTVADASSSLFQICVTLRQRLHGVPGFSESLEEEEEDADDDTDPVTLLWRTFRRGYPLMLLYNALRPDQPLTLPANTREDKRGKIATLKFLQACITDLKFPQEQCFIITDLYGDDTTGFVKVARVVNRVLDILVHEKLIDDIQPSQTDFEQAEKGLKRTQRQHIINELVTTERTYVQHLELLQAFKKVVEEKGVIPGDAAHDIFLNINALLDFQRRFLIRVEQTNALPEDEQNWGKLFVLYSDAFKVYEPYIANQKKCEKTVVANFSALASVASQSTTDVRQMVESSTSLYGFLMKPFQRLTKYPLLLDDLYKKGDLDEERKGDLLIGKEAATGVLARTNMAVDREEKVETVQELKYRVEDWKGHRVEGFGDLLLYGTFTVLKSENSGSGKDGERQYHVYLFETILLCCKDIDLSKPKNKLSNKQLVDKRGKPKLQLKGRIFMQNVTDVLTMARSGSYTCQIFWKGDPSIENFIIRFTVEDTMRKWAQVIEQQRRMYRDRSVRSSEGARSLGTSSTEFEFMRNQPSLENPYARMEAEEDDENEDENGTTGPLPYRNDFEQSRNGSSTSLRSRSTTGDSVQFPPVPNSLRQPPPRLPAGSMHQSNLSLRTRDVLNSTSASPAGDYAPPDSYFSPVEGSPMNSSRTSASSGMCSFPMPGQPLRAPNGYYDESAHHGHPHPPGSRFTAPAMARRDLSSSAMPHANGYPAQPGNAAAARTPRPGLHSATQMPGGAHRNRSASSPDIHNQARGPGGRVTSGVQQQPPVPDMPAPYNRSHTNSPSTGIQMQPTPRGARDVSPQMQRGDRRQMAPGSRTITPVPTRSETFSPPPTSLQTATSAPPLMVGDASYPTQLKVRVHCPTASQTLSLVVPANISYQSLKDRIDAKLQRSTNLRLSDQGPKESQVKLKFLDDDDYVSIQSDEDVMTAFETWREQQQGAGMAEVELFCQR